MKDKKPKPRVRVKGRFVSRSVERKLSKEAGKIDIYNPTPKQKKIIDEFLTTEQTFEVNNFKLLELVSRYKNTRINGRPVEQKTAMKFLAEFSQLLKEKTNAAVIIFKTKINEGERSIDVTIPDFRKRK